MGPKAITIKPNLAIVMHVHFNVSNVMNSYYTALLIRSESATALQETHVPIPQKCSEIEEISSKTFT